MLDKIRVNVYKSEERAIEWLSFFMCELAGTSQSDHTRLIKPIFEVKPRRYGRVESIKAVFFLLQRGIVCREKK